MTDIKFSGDEQTLFDLDVLIFRVKKEMFHETLCTYLGEDAWMVGGSYIGISKLQKELDDLMEQRKPLYKKISLTRQCIISAAAQKAL